VKKRGLGASLIVLSAVLLPSSGVGASAPERAYRPGDVVSDHGVALVIPQEGHGVYVEAITPLGVQEFGAETSADGSVKLLDQGEEPQAEPASGDGDGSSSSLGPCSDTAYSLLGYRESDTHSWSFRTASTPSNLTVDEARTAVKSGANHIVNSHNDCSRADFVEATHAYAGDTTRTTNITANSECEGGDTYNVVSFGDLALGHLGVACTYSVLGSPYSEVVESDVKLNNADYDWTVNPGSSCTRRFDVSSVMTHERGHTWGLGHVDEATNGHLTMSTAIAACQTKERTLGLGDMYGLEALY